MNLTVALTILCFVFSSIILNAVAVFYTICLNAGTLSFPIEPISIVSCNTLVSAAYMCLKDVNCAIFSKSGSQCSFFSKGNNSILCERELLGRTITSYFRIWACEFEPDPWTKVGHLYLHMTPEMYTCDQGQPVCSSLGGTMAEFYNATEMDNAYTFITDSVFVGSDYINGTYVWWTTGIEVSSDLWAPDQPLGEPCVQLWISDRGLDDTFSSRYNYVLCEKRIL